MASNNAAVTSVKISRRGAERIKGGHAWIYRSDVSANNVPPGSLVSVIDDRGRTIASALYSSSSQIALRLLDSGPIFDLPALIRERVSAAIAYRGNVVSNSNAYRLIFSESDFLPGLIVDRYNDLLVLQILTQALDAESVRQTIVSALASSLEPAGIIERVEPRIRELEQLPQKTSGLIFGQKSTTEFQMNGIRFHFDALEGQKTGAFLDQRENYAAAAQYAGGEALDVFCYQGGFALHLAEKCSKVTGVDSSRPALEVADQNAALNGRDIEWIEANAFDLLKDFASAGRQYDTIVLDPPAFAKNKQNLPTALRGYKELNLRAMKMLRPGGVLVSCSCSYHVTQADFLEMLASAAADAHRQLRLIEGRGQAKDHPILLTVPETAYLKCFVSRVSYFK